MLYTIVAVLVLVVDQAVKFWTVKTIPPLATGGDTVTVIPGVLHMTNVQNDGAAFSILADQRWLLVGVSALFIIAIIVLISMDIIHTKFGRWTAVLVMAGALGNCIDRVMYGYVVDMFEVELFSFAVFNVADIFITVCGILFCIHVIVYREPAEERNAVPRAARGKVRQLMDKHDDEPEDEYDDEEEEERPRRRTKAPAKANAKVTAKAKSKKERPDPYANVPKRGAHRSLAEEIRVQDPDDPFAEWNFDDEPRKAEKPAARQSKAPVMEDDVPAPRPARRRAAEPADDWEGLDFDVEEKPARKPAAAPAKKPAPAAPAAKPAPSAPAKKQDELDAGFDDYSLDDILSEFRDI